MKNAGRIAAVFFVCLMVFIAAVPAWATDIDDAKDKKQELEDKKKNAERLLGELENKKSNTEAYIKTLDENLIALGEEIDRLEGEIDSANKDLKKTKKELKTAEKTESEQYDIMKRRIQYMYENGSSSYIDLFLNAKSMSDFLNQAEYMSKIAEYDNQLLNRYENAKISVQQKKDEIEVKLENLAILSESVKIEQNTVEKLAQSKAAEVAKYEQQIQNSDAQIADFAKAVEEQESIIDRLVEEQMRKEEEERRRQEEEKKRQEEERRRQEEERRKQEEAQQGQQETEEPEEEDGNNGSGNNGSGNSNSGNDLLSGGFIWPLPSSTRITSNFGGRDAPLAGASTYHKGLDIGTPAGNNILAAASGTVVEATYNYAMGNYVLVSHGSGIFTIYEHCSKLLVSAGQSVSQGEVIALVGSTGISSGPHLHFGMKINGEYVNPLNYVSY